jgi:bifunctional non-homologous end joining protein LigD
MATGLRLEHNGGRVRLLTRGDYDWTRLFPWIVEAALKNHQKQFVIDGDAMILGVDDVSDLPTEMARSERFELPTLGFEVRCSIQLSYERVPFVRLPD